MFIGLKASIGCFGGAAGGGARHQGFAFPLRDRSPLRALRAGLSRHILARRSVLRYSTVPALRTLRAPQISSPEGKQKRSTTGEEGGGAVKVELVELVIDGRVENAVLISADAEVVTADEKRKVAEAAASLVDDGWVIATDVGSPVTSLVERVAVAMHGEAVSATPGQRAGWQRYRRAHFLPSAEERALDSGNYS